MCSCSKELTDNLYSRYTSPEPSEIIVKKINYECSGDERQRSSREELRYREDSDLEHKYQRDVEPKYRNER